MYPPPPAAPQPDFVTRDDLQQMLSSVYTGLVAHIEQLAPPKVAVGTDMASNPLFSSTPQEPKYQVYFDMGSLGVMNGRYHAVDVSDTGVMLAFDTRFRYAAQYMPPISSADAPPWQVFIVQEESQQQIGPLPCVSLGFRHRLDNCELIILLRSPETSPDGGQLEG